MPWRLQAKKDVQACEKLRGAGNEALIRRCPNGETHPFTDGFRRAQRAKTHPLASGCVEERTMCEGVSHPEYIGVRKRTR